PLPRIQEYLAVSPDGKLLATCCRMEGPIYLWDATTGQQLRQIGDAARGAYSLHFSPDGSTILAARFGAIGLWDVATGKEVTPPNWDDGLRGTMKQRYFLRAALSSRATAKCWRPADSAASPAFGTLPRAAGWVRRTMRTRGTLSRLVFHRTAGGRRPRAPTVRFASGTSLPHGSNTLSKCKTETLTLVPSPPTAVSWRRR